MQARCSHKDPYPTSMVLKQKNFLILSECFATQEQFAVITHTNQMPEAYQANLLFSP